MRTGALDTSSKVWVYAPDTHKTEHLDKQRTIHLGPQAQEVLRPWLRSDPVAHLFSPKEAMAERSAQLRRDRKTHSAGYLAVTVSCLRPSSTECAPVHSSAGTPLSRPCSLPSTAAHQSALRRISEHSCDFAKVLPSARALREQIDWAALRTTAKGNPYAEACLFLLDRLEVAADQP